MEPEIDADAFFADLDELNRLGTVAGRPGVNRIAFSPADLAGRAFLEGRLRELGLVVGRDPAGNSVARRAGRDAGLAPLALGSHTDTVPEGGRFDGALGVVAALACARAVAAAGAVLRHPLEIIDFVAEEATMGGGTLGSRAMCGLLEPGWADASAFDGRPVREHLEAAGIDPSAVAGAARESGSLAAYLELHVEQGGTLEAEDDSLGVVEGIVGIRRYEAVFEGVANHAGTTPMAGRRDALVMAAPFVSGLREVALAQGVVGTAGTLQVHPGAPNVIPGRVDVGCEIRSLEEARLDRAEEELQTLAAAMGGRLRTVSAKAPVRSDPDIVSLLGDVCSGLGERWRVMSSGAGHDAMCMASLTRQAMLFVPSRGGISHSPSEHTTPAHCLLGARALLSALLTLDGVADDGSPLGAG
jgi:beta-ureidopropionase / N-carbamoyl-L-amino-acid hydrolase